ncbi:MAG: arginine--tRNA ligase, partial [Spirochaetia bacterium]|nr:arginine--tRNA ligase [Spirochaetia bacterium]
MIQSTMKFTFKKFLSNLLTDAVKNIALSRNIIINSDFTAKIEYPPSYSLGQYSSPVAMECARIFKESPANIAQLLLEIINKNPENRKYFSELQIVHPGFINFYLSGEAHQNLMGDVFSSLETMYAPIQSKNQHGRIIFEFVSANPTGPLNIVSARAAAVGDSICRILKAAKCNVYREYYVNDFGNQVRLLGLSLAARYLQKLGHDAPLPEEGYQGEYIKDVLEDISKNDTTLKGIAGDISRKNLAEVQEQLGEYFAPLAVEKLRSTHEKDLASFGVYFDNFFSEKSLHDQKEVEKILSVLQASGFVYELDGALLFQSTKFGDEKDRVIVRSDGRPTYLLADIAYHKSKIDRGFQKIYDIWGPDHHGYIARLKGALKSIHFPEKENEDFEVFIVQQVNMIEDGKPVVMSKRLGKFHTMNDLLEKIPADVVRYFFLLRSQSSHLDFDLDLATTQSNKNPVYYIQYAAARICSIFREAKKDIDEKINLPEYVFTDIKKSGREELLSILWRYPEIVEQVSVSFEVHILSEYLYNVAQVFTRFYHEKENNVLATFETNYEEGCLLLKICQLTRVVLKEGLSLLGV